MYIKARLRRALAVLLLSPAGQRDQRDILAPSMQSHLSRRLVPIHPRHTQVKQYDVRLERLGDFKRLWAVANRSDVVSGELKLERQGLGRILIVIGHQDATRLQRRNSVHFSGMT